MAHHTSATAAITVTIAVQLLFQLGSRAFPRSSTDPSTEGAIQPDAQSVRVDGLTHTVGVDEREDPRPEKSSFLGRGGVGNTIINRKLTEKPPGEAIWLIQVGISPWLISLIRGACFMLPMYCHMMHGPNNQGTARDFNYRIPPGWDPAGEAHYSFRAWQTCLSHWIILTDLQPPHQSAAIVM